jgi:quercetin dioxygenase-like cupin family protein
MSQPATYVRSILAIVAGVGCASQPRSAPTQPEPVRINVAAVGVPGGCALPAAEHTGDVGCYLTAVEPLTADAGYPIYWYLHTFPSRTAAENARPVRGTIVESLGKVWLFTMAQDSWRPPSGEFVARVGPIPLTRGKAYTVRYMEATFTPGMHTAPHRHPGPEAWFVLTGAQCLETPDGAIVVRAGHSAIVREGPPMQLSGVGTQVRRALVLIVHDPSLPFTVPAHDWNAKGLCSK